MWRLTIPTCFLGGSVGSCIFFPHKIMTFHGKDFRAHKDVSIVHLSYMEFHFLFVELELETRTPKEYISPFSKIPSTFLKLSRNSPLLEVVFMYVKTWAFWYLQNDRKMHIWSPPWHSCCSL